MRSDATVEEHKEYLGRIDAIAGDGDHGIGMSRGSKAAAEAAERDRGRGRRRCWARPAHAFGDKAGGTSGILWGLLLDGVGKGLGNTEAVTAEASGRRRPGLGHRPADLQQGELGDKTMLDALFPFVDTLVERGRCRRARCPMRGGAAADACVQPRPRRPHRSTPRSAGRGRWRNAASAPPTPAPYRRV